MTPDRVVPGQVVSSDADDDSDQVQPQETFLHKVASGPGGPVSASMAGRHARTVRAGWRNGADPDDAYPGDTDPDDTDPDDTDADDTDVYGIGDENTDVTDVTDDTADDDTDVDDTEVMAPANADDRLADNGPAHHRTAYDRTGYDRTDADAVGSDAAVVDVAEVDVAEVDVAEVDVADAGVPTVADDPTAGVDTMDAAETTPDVPAVPVPAEQDADEPLLGEVASRIQEEWRHAQGSFVDDPHASVAMAAGVVADAAARLESLLRERQRNLRGSWDGNGQADTETLRQSLLTYRRLLHKLIS